jgi:hypothetical protein
VAVVAGVPENQLVRALVTFIPVTAESGCPASHNGLEDSLLIERQRATITVQEL